MSAEYVKICPQCGQHSPEHEGVCPHCGQFLGLVRPVLQERDPAPDLVVEQSRFGSGENGERFTMRLVPAGAPEKVEPVLILESLEGDRIFRVLSGQTVGQAHPTSSAEVQMTGIPNLNYVSRQHCRFDFESGDWYVTCLPSALNGLTLRGAELSTGGRALVRDGDRLEMANVPFLVRIGA